MIIISYAMYLLVRYGPAPDDTLDGDGLPHVHFTGFFVLPFTNTPEDFTEVVREIWTRATGEGAGHILIGSCSGFEYCAAGSPACGFLLETSPAPVAPKDYIPLYAVARAKNPPIEYMDVAVDYRVVPPGDPAVRPFLFGLSPTAHN